MTRFFTFTACVVMSIFFMGMIMTNADAAQNAIVTKDKAIVYADVHMKNPLGYVTKWQRVKVGDYARNLGRVIPVVITNKRIAYIKTDDISIGNHNTYKSNSRIYKDLNEQYDEDRIALGIGQHMADHSIARNSVNTLGVRLTHDLRFHRRLALRSGFEFNSYSGTHNGRSESIQTLNFLSGVNWDFIKSYRWQVGLSALAMVAPYAKADTASYNKTTIAYGGEVGLYYARNFKNHYQARFNIGYKALTYSAEQSSKQLETNGMQLSVSFGYYL